MKKVFAILAIAAMSSMVACGNGDDAKKKSEDSARQADSMARIKRSEDSARMADSTAKAAADAATTDTTAKTDTAAGATGTGTTN